MTVSLNGEQEQRTALCSALAGQEAVAATMADHVASYVGLHAAAATALAARQSPLGRSPAALAGELRAVKQAYPGITVFSLYDAAGRGVARSDDLPIVQAGSISMYAMPRYVARADRLSSSASRPSTAA